MKFKKQNPKRILIQKNKNGLQYIKICTKLVCDSSILGNQPSCNSRLQLQIQHQNHPRIQSYWITALSTQTQILRTGTKLKSSTRATELR